MKNYKIIVLTALLFTATFYSANATPYFGIGYQMNSINYNSESTIISGFNFSYELEDYLEEDFSNINLFVGYKVNDKIALEIGYFSKKDESKLNSNTGLEWTGSGNPLTTSTKSDLQIVNLDGIYSFEANSRLSLLGIASISKIDFNYTTNYLDNGVSQLSESIDDNGFGIGAGLGLETKLINNVSARFIAKYTQTLGIDSFDDFVSYNVALKYQF